MAFIDPYGPMVNGKAYSAEDIRRLQTAVCEVCGERQRRRTKDVTCGRTRCEIESGKRREVIGVKS